MSMIVCWDELRSKNLWHLFCKRHRFALEEISDNTNFSFWSARQEWMYWFFFRFYAGQFPRYFFPTRKALLRNSSWTVSTFWIAPFSSNYNNARVCYFDIFLCLEDSPALGKLWMVSDTPSLLTKFIGHVNFFPLLYN